jgi:hypothetical protein
MMLYALRWSQRGDGLNSRFTDWIWHIKGSIALPKGQSADEAFERLNPLFDQDGTSHKRTDDTLTFRKKNQAAQDKMSIFDGGVLQIESEAAEPVLRYHLTSKALLLCFLAPLLFLAFASITIMQGALQKPPTAAEKEEAKKQEEKLAKLPQNPIDKALGSPAPEKPKKEDKEKSKKEDDDKPSPKAAYIFAGIFAALYMVGRILEARLIKSTFRKNLTAPSTSSN